MTALHHRLRAVGEVDHVEMFVRPGCGPSLVDCDPFPVARLRGILYAAIIEDWATGPTALTRVKPR